MNAEQTVSDASNDSSDNTMRPGVAKELMNTQDEDGTNMDELRLELQRHFMSPYDKIIVRKTYKSKQYVQFSAYKKKLSIIYSIFKPFVQLLKIAVLTSQFVYIGIQQTNYVNFAEGNSMALRHVFLEKGHRDPWKKTYYAYTASDVYEHLNFAIRRYFRDDGSLAEGMGAYQVIKVNDTSAHSPMTLCICYLRDSELFPNNSFILGNIVDTECMVLNQSICPEKKQCVDIRKTLNTRTKLIEDNFMVSMHLNFELFAINMEIWTERARPSCYLFNVSIDLDNTVHDGVLQISLKNNIQPAHCNATLLYNVHWLSSLAVPIAIVVVCLTSLVIATHSILLAIILEKKTCRLLKENRKLELSVNDRLKLYNGYHFANVICALFGIVGILLYIFSSNTVYLVNVRDFDHVVIVLGIAVLLAWFGVLRYFAFFKETNIFVFTLKRSLPILIRFLFCCSVMFVAFTLFAWVVFGPYHEKFRTFGSSFFCLFSLINGDDMFSTFSALDSAKHHPLIFYFNRLFLVTHILFFSYAVLNIFIAIITSMYDAMRESPDSRHPNSPLFDFIYEKKEMSDVKERTLCDILKFVATNMCCKDKSEEEVKSTALRNHAVYRDRASKRTSNV